MWVVLQCDIQKLSTVKTISQCRTTHFKRIFVFQSFCEVVGSSKTQTQKPQSIGDMNIPCHGKISNGFETHSKQETCRIESTKANTC
mmetsp:Transcript_35119/g.42386  ORF Transcript_35119/g.42386 Transcript_35119/m.42386 type:complete len:87 (+) Transcript_35119:599-859(+)